MKKLKKSVSLSTKIKRKILEYIKKKNFKPDESIPSEFVLMDLFNVSRYTIREALALLEQENILYKIHGKGTFVNKIPVQIESGLEKLQSITDIIKDFGYIPGTVWVDISERKPTKDMIEKLELEKGEKVVTFTRIRKASDIHAVYCIDTVKKSDLNIKVEEEIEKESFFDFFQSECGIVIEYAVADIIPVQPDKEMVDNMDISGEEFFLLLNQIHYDKEGIPRIYSKDYFNTKVFKFKVNRFK